MKRQIIQQSLQLSVGQQRLNLTLKRSSQRKSLSLSVNSDSQVTVYAPRTMSDKAIIAFIELKAEWIIRNQRKLLNSHTRKRLVDYKSGSQFYFLGKKYPLWVESGENRNAKISFDGESWNVCLPEKRKINQTDKFLIKKKLMQWYQMQAKEIFAGRLFIYARLMGLEINEILIRGQKRVWGVCAYAHKRISLNWQLIQAPIEVIDYVIVHELAHLIHPNHSRIFWRKVEKIIPRYREYKKWLRDNQDDLIHFSN